MAKSPILPSLSAACKAICPRKSSCIRVVTLVRFIPLLYLKTLTCVHADSEWAFALFLSKVS